MSASTLPLPAHDVNRRHRKNICPGNPSPSEIPTRWRESCALEAIAPDGLRGGLARARTRLLDTVPTWQLPEVLDSLTAGGAAI